MSTRIRMITRLTLVAAILAASPVAADELDDLARARASVTPLAGTSPFTLEPGTDRIGNAIVETEKLIRLRKQPPLISPVPAPAGISEAAT